MLYVLLRILINWCAAAHSEVQQCSEDVQQSDDNYSCSDTVFVATKYFGNTKKQLVCMDNDISLLSAAMIQNEQKVGLTNSNK